MSIKFPKIKKTRAYNTQKISEKQKKNIKDNVHIQHDTFIHCFNASMLNFTPIFDVQKYTVSGAETAEYHGI